LYDAGDFGKYTVSGGIALWQLLHLADLRVGETRPDAAVVQECRWQLDWMLRMQVPPGHALAGMAFHRVHGTTWSPLPGWAHEDPTPRVLHRPSTAATLHLAATAACGARLFARLDPAYADLLLTAARTAHEAARIHPPLHAPDDEGRNGGGPYGDAEAADDFYWAAAELWLTTGEERYAAQVEASTWHSADVFEPDGFDFDRVAIPARLDLARRPPTTSVSDGTLRSPSSPPTSTSQKRPPVAGQSESAAESDRGYMIYCSRHAILANSVAEALPDIGRCERSASPPRSKCVTRLLGAPQPHVESR
jgi:hypothetical protein